jgi:hypothetical protein
MNGSAVTGWYRTFAVLQLDSQRVDIVCPPDESCSLQRVLPKGRKRGIYLQYTQEWDTNRL